MDGTTSKGVGDHAVLLTEVKESFASFVAWLGRILEISKAREL